MKKALVAISFLALFHAINAKAGCVPGLEALSGRNAALVEKNRQSISETINLYRENIGHDVLWTGIETADPLDKKMDYRWNSLNDIGFYDRATRQKIIKNLRQLGIRNIRFGLPVHEIKLGDEASWQNADAMIRDLSDAGINVSLDIHHFGIESDFLKRRKNGNINWLKTFYLNPQWPDYFADFAKEVYRRYHNQVAAFTLINEPEPNDGGQSEWWNGGHPGWASPDHFKFYIERGLRMGEAAVKARRAIEQEAKHLRSAGDLKKGLPLFLHSEAVTIKPPSWVDFNQFVRFFPSDLILGADWIINADLTALKKMTLADLQHSWDTKPQAEKTSFDWTVHTYIFGQPQKSWAHAKKTITQRLARLQLEHRLLAKENRGTTMKIRTLFGFDYYAQNENPGQNEKELGELPHEVVDQIKNGQRLGPAVVMQQYFEHYQMAMIVTETSTPFPEEATDWYTLMGTQVRQAFDRGVPVLGLTIYPLKDTYGWENALSLDRKSSILNPAGLIDSDGNVRDFAKPVIGDLRRTLAPLAL